MELFTGKKTIIIAPVNGLATDANDCPTESGLSVEARAEKNEVVVSCFQSFICGCTMPCCCASPEYADVQTTASSTRPPTPAKMERGVVEKAWQQSSPSSTVLSSTPERLERETTPPPQEPRDLRLDHPLAKSSPIIASTVSEDSEDELIEKPVLKRDDSSPANRPTNDEPDSKPYHRNTEIQEEGYMLDALMMALNERHKPQPQKLAPPRKDSITRRTVDSPGRPLPQHRSPSLTEKKIVDVSSRSPSLPERKTVDAPHVQRSPSQPQRKTVDAPQIQRSPSLPKKTVIPPPSRQLRQPSPAPAAPSSPHRERRIVDLDDAPIEDDEHYESFEVRAPKSDFSGNGVEETKEDTFDPEEKKSDSPLHRDDTMDEDEALDSVAELRRFVSIPQQAPSAVSELASESNFSIDSINTSIFDFGDTPGPAGGGRETPVANNRSPNRLFITPSVVSFGGRDYPFGILGVRNQTPRVLTPAILEVLRGFVPIPVINDNFWLKFSRQRDGKSINTLLHSMRPSQYSILAVETKTGHVFGAFLATPWRLSNEWYGSKDSFLFRLKHRRTKAGDFAHDKEIQVYPCTGHDAMIQYCTRSTIAVGGGDWNDVEQSAHPGEPRGIGFMIDGDLMGGETNACATFDNPRLGDRSQDNEFDIAELEMWTLTQAVSLEEAERMEMHRMFIAEHRRKHG